MRTYQHTRARTHTQHIDVIHDPHALIKCVNVDPRLRTGICPAYFMLLRMRARGRPGFGPHARGSGDELAWNRDGTSHDTDNICRVSTTKKSPDPACVRVWGLD